MPGILDNVTILRYAHVYRERTSGGVEQYISNLDRALLVKHRMTVLQTYLCSSDKDQVAEVEDVGIGRIIWLPIPIRQAKPTLLEMPKRARYICRCSAKLRLRNGQKMHWAVAASGLDLIRHRGGHLRHEGVVLSDYLSLLLTKGCIDLLSVHWLSYETGRLIRLALCNHLPFVFINHFENERFRLPQMRRWIAGAAGVATVSRKDLPNEIRQSSVILSDAVDTDFFNVLHTRPVISPKDPIVLLAGRVTEGKGHEDLLQAAAILAGQKEHCVICFAGAVESRSLQHKLRCQIASAGLDPAAVIFLGEVSQDVIREWYGKSDIVVLPSYSEGLPRVVLEAQAMKKAVVAYDCGGTCEALLPNETGFLVPAGNIEALADRIGFLLRNKAVRHRMGDAGRKFVSRCFSLPALVERHEQFYVNALAKRALS